MKDNITVPLMVQPRYASMPDIEEQLKDRMEALAAAQERQGTAEEHCSMVRSIVETCFKESRLCKCFQSIRKQKPCQLENTVEEKNCELGRLGQRLKMNEEHNAR